MTTNYYQAPTTPKLYASYLLYQYAMGALDRYEVPAGIAIAEDPAAIGSFFEETEAYSPAEMIRMIQLDPARTSYIYDFENRGQIMLSYKLVPDEFNLSSELLMGVWKNITDCFLLGHNFSSCDARVEFGTGVTDDEEDFVGFQQQTIINNVFEPEFDGWSHTGFTNVTSYNDLFFKIRIRSQLFTFDDFSQPFVQQPLKLGSLFIGNSYTFPQNCNLNTSVNFNYGAKRTKTVAGKTLSTAKWTKPDSWGGQEPWGLTTPFDPANNEHNFLRRTGLRTWKITFDSLGPDKLMNQNPMLNSNGWVSQDTDNDNLTATSESADNIIGVSPPTAGEVEGDFTGLGQDFFTSIVHRSLGGHLPMILQLDKDNPSPHNFAIVRMNPNYSVKQKAPNLYNITLTLEEQV